MAYEDARNLSKIRNAGLAKATGDYVVTCDADSRLHPLAFQDIHTKLSSGKFIGGGCAVFPERWSLGIAATSIVLIPMLFKYRVSFGAFWTTRAACEAIGGFDDDWVTVEDLDFALRLKAYGRSKGKKFGTLARAYLMTSCRKFDQHGDWHLVRDRDFIRRAFNGHDQQTGDDYWYFPNR